MSARVEAEIRMEKYKNLGGNSAVRAFEIAADSIRVRFDDGGIYLYTRESAGPEYFAAMCELATMGRGLNAFINKFVRENYAEKIR